MYIKSMVLDGFKSYGQRTEIHGFDREFNAITGLNGTGKSNILDAICFVLGITNLNQVRAGSLQDLIYKSGQAGVVKATVSITFDNSDSRSSPPGFDKFEEITITRQVAVGGKNKYMINGSVVTNKRIHDLFCSIQLNVNNPHFLIMQGRVTKVINMKPPEILGMVEEAVGTRMYETKRQASVKLLEKKDAKLTELNSVINEEITPKLDKLRDQRERYFEFQRLERELENMREIYNAFKFIYSKRVLKAAEASLKEGEQKVQTIHNEIKEKKKHIATTEKETEEMSNSIEKSRETKLSDLEAHLKEKGKLVAKSVAAEKSAKEAIVTEQNKKEALEKNLYEDELAVETKKKELANVEGLFKKLQDDDAADNEAFAISQRKYEAVSAGMEVNEAGEAETLQEQLIATERETAEATTEIERSTMQINHFQSVLKEKQKELGSNIADYHKDKANVEKLQQEVAKLQTALSKINYSEPRMTELEQKRRALANEIRHLEERIENFEDRNPHVNFQYRDPEANFDRGRVKGAVCKLIQLMDVDACMALETAAGGRLYNIVVDDADTSKKLLKSGQLRHRTTFIPLKQIQSNRIGTRMEQAAHSLVGEENVQTALSLVRYDPALQKAMEYIFGNVFVCRDLNVARAVAFCDRILRKCVTREGDVVDPSGVLSGGAPKKGASILMQIADIIKCELQLQGKRRELHAIDGELRAMAVHRGEYEKMRQMVELRQHELELVEQRFQNTRHHQQQQQVDTLVKNIAELTEKIQVCRGVQTKNGIKVKELQSKMKDTKGYRDRQLKEAEADMKRLKTKADASRKKWKQREQEFHTLNLEVAELIKGFDNTKQQIAASAEQIVKLIAQHEQLAQVARDAHAQLQVVDAEYRGEKEVIMEANKEIRNKIKYKEKLVADINELELHLKELDHEIAKRREDLQRSQTCNAGLTKRTNTETKYYAEAEKLTDAEGNELLNTIKRNEDKRGKMSRMVNAKAHSLFESEERQYQDLMKKKRVVENDKRKILQIIGDLDNQKKQAILLAYEQVTKDFGSIFSSLLPGADAKLEPPRGQTILQGLEVRIALGGVWKESLLELSGGQRSLVALSLILAMLLFKPAPLYILDEVDAALDLSHTQNIGNMLKLHFKQSQFIIVSLKDGMFNNANVLFRTRFVDGMSAITRTVNRARSA